MKKHFLFFAALCCSLMTFGGQVFHSLISVEDNSVADWDQVPEEYLFECSTAPNAVKNALKSVKVYADAMYINIYVTWDEEQITDKEWVPFHIFLDADNSDATGGYGDEFTDPNADWLLESSFISGGASNNYDPAVFKWWGEVGGNGWEWVDPNTGHTDADFWGAIIGEGQGSIGQSQLIGDNGCEIQLLREAATCITFAETFGIGFDIQQNWSSVGVLPNANADEVGSEVLAAKMKVTIDNEGYENYDIIEGDLSYRTLSESTVSVSSCDPDARVITIPSSIVVDGVTYLVTRIGNYAFEGCTGLTSIIIPNSVTTIGERAFAGCTGLTSIIIPKSVTTIEEKAFYGCYGLKTVFNVSGLPISKGSTSYGYVAYYADNVYEGTPVGDFIFANETILVKYLGNGSSVTIPDFVTQIEKGAFDGCSSLTSIVWNAKNCSLSSYNTLNSISNQITSFIFGNEVEVIPSYLCSGMTKLTSITIPNSVTTIGGGAFSGCSGLTSITIPNSVTSIGNWVFYGCFSLTSVTIPNSVTTIGNYAFEDCTGLTSIIIPNSVTTIGYEAFYGCSGLTSVTIPNSVTTIGILAFYKCSGLTSAIIGNSVTTIGESAFENCTYLKTITLGKSLTDIGCNAFKGDFRVEEITSYAEVTPNVCSSTFDGLSKQYIYLYVPENSIRAYQVDPNWNGFDIRTKAADKKPIDGDNPIVTPSDQDVIITWPITDGTDTYTLTITKNGEVVCVLTFNAQGQLTNIAFAAPGRDGAHQAPAATLTAQGYQFTVTGLNPGTAYDYSVTATDAGGQTLAEHKGNFSTTGGTGFKSVHDSQCTMHKYFHNGNLIIERNGIKYTATGQKVR